MPTLALHFAMANIADADTDANVDPSLRYGYVAKVPHERLMLKVNAHGVEGDAAR